MTAPTTRRARWELPLHSFDRDRSLASEPMRFAMGSFAKMAPFSYASFPHRHEFYELVCVTGGSGKHVIDFVSYDVRPVSLFVVAPRQVQSWECQTPLEGHLILFMEEFLPAGYGDRVGPALRLHPSQTATITAVLDGLEREYRRREACERSVLQAYLHILLIEMHRMRDVGATPTEDDRATVLARRFLRLVSDDTFPELTVRGYAERIGVTPKHLADVVKRCTGKTPAEVIREVLTVEAKRMLAHTDRTVAQIAETLSFDTPSYFGRFFKRETGLSPGEFRRQTRDAQERWPGREIPDQPSQMTTRPA